MKNILICLFFCYFSVFYSLTAQSYFLEKTALSNIITNSSVEDIYQDSDGFLWFATHTGLVQYSGSFSRVFSPKGEGGLKTEAEFFYKIAEDKDKNLWIGSRNGLVFLNSERSEVTTFKKSADFPLPNNRIFDLMFYNDSTLFLACDRSGLTSLNIRTMELSQITPDWHGTDSPIENIWIRQHWKGKDDNIYLRTSAGFFIYHPKSNELYRFKDDKLADFQDVSRVLIVGQDYQKDFWFIDSRHTLYLWNPGQKLEGYSLTDWSDYIESGVFGIFPFDSTRIIIATNKGNLLFDSENKKVQPLRLRGNSYFDPPDVRVVSLLRTREDVVFMGFRAGVTGMINPLYQNFTFVEIDKKKPEELLSAVFILDDNEYNKRYISTFLYPAIIVEDLKTGEFFEIPKPFPGNLSSNRMIIDKSGRLWITQNKGVLEVDRQTLESKIYKTPENTFNIFEIVEVSPGSFMVGSFAEGLFLFSSEDGKFEKIPEEKGWIKTQIFSMTFDSARQILWIGTVRNGLFMHDLERDTFIQFMPDINNPYSIGGDWVRSMALGTDDKLWFAADPVGLGSFCYNSHPDSAFQSYGLEDGLPSNFIAGIVFDKNDQLWMSSLAGVAKLDPFTLEVEIFQPDNGSRNQTFYYNNMSVNNQNELFIGSNNGYFTFNPENLSNDHTPPSVRLIEMEILDSEGSKKIRPPKEGNLRLKYNQNNIRIEFAVINYTQPESNEIYYSLNDKPDTWQRVEGSNQVYFSSLSPGSYTFRLKAKNYAGEWSDNEIKIPFFIAQPFYNTWWFFLLLLLIISSIVYLVYHYQLNQRLKASRLEAEKENLRARMEKQMADLKLLSLRSQMNPHFIFNCLNSINRFILVNDNDTASEYLTKFARLIRKVLDNSRVDKITLDIELETLQLYIEMEKLRFVQKFDFSINIHPNVKADELLIQPMIIQPYVENAIWHGLMHRKTKGELMVEVEKDQDCLIVIVSDNGIGREASKKIRSQLQFKHKSYGMKVTEERMEIEKYRSSIKTNLKITDLYDVENNAIGTKVEIILPLEYKKSDSY